MERKYRYLCFSCGAEQLIEKRVKPPSRIFISEILICHTCGANNMFQRDKGKTLRSIKNTLLVIAIAVLVYVSYSISHTEKVKSVIREVDTYIKSKNYE